MKKEIEIFPNWEMEDELIIVGKCTAEDALELAKKEYPETSSIYEVDCVHPVEMHRCLDCGSLWISDDVCGECGEPRLSKRILTGWHIY